MEAHSAPNAFRRQRFGALFVVADFAWCSVDTNRLPSCSISKFSWVTDELLPKALVREFLDVTDDFLASSVRKGCSPASLI